MLDVEIVVKITYLDGDENIVQKDPDSLIGYIIGLVQQGIAFDYEVEDVIL